MDKQATYTYGAPDKYGEFPYLYQNKWSKENLKAILLERLPKSYDMQLVEQEEIDILAKVVNMGIDAHLEAATRTKELHVIGHKYAIGFDREGMACLIRRLMESQEDVAHNLVSSILETLGIEYSGC